MAQQASDLSKESLKRIIQEGDARELVLQAETLGTKFGKKKGRDSPVTTNQIRAIFGTVRQIEMNWPIRTSQDKQDEQKEKEQREKAERAKRSLMLLKPKVVYRAARERAPEFKQFAQVVTESVDMVLADGGDTRQRFGYFVDFFEAMMAYHKAASEER